MRDAEAREAMEIAEAVAAVERAMAAEEAELARMLSEVSTSFSPDSSRKRSATWAALESVPAQTQDTLKSSPRGGSLREGGWSAHAGSHTRIGTRSSEAVGSGAAREARLLRLAHLRLRHVGLRLLLERL